jgi:lysozyme
MPSEQCSALVKDFEKCKLYAYTPVPGDPPTIGWGSTGPDIHIGLTWTQAQADNRLHVDLMRVGVAVDRLVNHKANQNQFDALCDFAYNLGAHALAESTLLAFHLAGRYDKAALEFPKWDHAHGVELAGLKRRRLAEQALYERPML